MRQSFAAFSFLGTEILSPYLKILFLYDKRVQNKNLSLHLSKHTKL
jgi:hypothetical protein